MESLLAQSVFEVRYRRGMVFLDKCGSIMVALEDELHADGMLSNGAPGMEYGELVCHTDQLILRYGPKNTTVVQHWVKRPTRIEIVAPKAWSIISKAMAVERQVLRAGARFIFQWKVESISSAWSRVKRFIDPHSSWSELFGEPSRGSYVSVSKGLRSSVDIIEQRTSPSTAAPIKELISPLVIQLDLDFAHPDAARPFTLESESEEEETFSLGPGQAKDFFRDSWIRARDLSERFAKVILQP